MAPTFKDALFDFLIDGIRNLSRRFSYMRLT